jgi:uncharacterized membrane protein YdjX (TVP38/TMEM64 family)
VLDQPSSNLPILEIDDQSVSTIHRSWSGLAIKLLAALLLLGAIFLVWQTWIEPQEAHLDDALKRLGPWGPVLFISIFLVATSLFFPESVLAIAAGTIFGLWWGLLWVVVAGTLTAIAIFWLGRRVMRDPVTRILSRHPKIKAVDNAASDSGLKLIFLLRLAPLNYTLLCWLFSVSKIRFRIYVISCLGMFPGNFSTVYLGFAARHTADLATRLKDGDPPVAGDSLIHEITLYGGLLISMMVSLMVARIAVRAIHAASTPAPTAANDQ